MMERTMLVTSCSVHVSFSNTYVFDVYKLIAGVSGRFNTTDTYATENDFLGLSRDKAGRCVWHGSSTGLLLKSPVNSSSAIYRIQANREAKSFEEFPSWLRLVGTLTKKLRKVTIDTSGLRETVCCNVWRSPDARARSIEVALMRLYLRQ